METTMIKKPCDECGREIREHEMEEASVLTPDGYKTYRFCGDGGRTVWLEKNTVFVQHDDLKHVCDGGRTHIHGGSFVLLYND